MKLRKPNTPKPERKEVNPLLLVDGNNLVARMTHVFLGLKSVGIDNGGLFGSIQVLSRFLGKFEFSGIYFCVDKGVPEFRKKAVLASNKIGNPDGDMILEYKGNRPDAEDEFKAEYIRQIKLAEEHLPKLGINVAYALGYEADDVIAGLARSAKSRRQRVVVYSNDGDMVQLKDDSISVYHPTKDIFIQEVPKGLLIKKAIVGDSSDNIKGVPGIGAKRADAVFDELNISEEYRDDIQFFVDELSKYQGSNKFVLKVKEHAKAVELAHSALDLSMTEEEVMEHLEINRGVLDSVEIVKMFKEFRFNDFLENFKMYIRPFERAISG